MRSLKTGEADVARWRVHTRREARGTEGQHLTKADRLDGPSNQTLGGKVIRTGIQTGAPGASCSLPPTASCVLFRIAM